MVFNEMNDCLLFVVLFLTTYNLDTLMMIRGVDQPNAGFP